MRELNYIDETIERDENPALRIGNVGRSALSTVYLMDCIEGMKQFPDKIFDLAVVDPPYGFRTEKTGILNFRKGANEKVWNVAPTAEYFDELKRVSKNQIVWGGNYFPELWVNGCRCFVYWHKGNPVPNFADGELAWTSFDRNAKQCDYRYYGNLEGKSSAGDKFHPTQKPIYLYEWIFKEFTVEGNLILDTHLGSQSSRIAANKAGLDFVGFEIDREYYDNGNKRFKNFVSQGVLF